VSSQQQQGLHAIIIIPSSHSINAIGPITCYVVALFKHVQMSGHLMPQGNKPHVTQWF
jgi:hypothetical protein